MNSTVSISSCSLFTSFLCHSIILRLFSKNVGAATSKGNVKPKRLGALQPHELHLRESSVMCGHAMYMCIACAIPQAWGGFDCDEMFCKMFVRQRLAHSIHQEMTHKSLRITVQDLDWHGIPRRKTLLKKQKSALTNYRS